MYFIKILSGTSCFLALLLTSALSGDAPSTTATPARQAFRVTSAILEALPQVYEGPCPATIQFKGRITANGSGKVQYRFRRSDGEASPIFTLEFKKPGTERVTHAWKFAGPSEARFSEWVSIKIISPNEVESARAVFRGSCSQRPLATPGPPRPDDPPPPPPPTSGRFRVIINGFSCGRGTFDDERQTDGVDDEVFVRVDSRLYDSSGTQTFVPIAQSPVFGDQNHFPNRIRAGSGHSVFGGNGGFHHGDNYPGERPWERTLEPLEGNIPLLVWEGELRQSQNALLIIPSIWEWDGDTSLEDRYSLALARIHDSHDITSEMRRAISGTTYQLGTLRPFFAEVKVSKAFPGDPKNRPIGMVDFNESYVYRPQWFVLTFEQASRWIDGPYDSSVGPGVRRFEFIDDNALQGVYVLYLQIERIP